MMYYFDCHFDMDTKRFELNYVQAGDYFIPNLRLPEESRPIGHWGRLHREYLKEYRPIIYNQLVLSGKLWTYLADINEQAQERMDVMINQMKEAEGVTEKLKAEDQMEWVGTVKNYAQICLQTLC